MERFVYSNGTLRIVGKLGRLIERPNFRCHHRTIKTTTDLRATLRAGACTSLGGYPVYLLTEDGAALHVDCAKGEYRQISTAIRHKRSDGWLVIACDVNYEDNDLLCDHCGETIESAYGDPSN